jgi:hypothetical protein
VRNFYHLICSKLDVIPLDNPQTSLVLPTITEIEKSFLILRKHTPPPPPPEVLPWTPQTVWDTLVAIFVDQQGLKPKQILPDARIAEDRRRLGTEAPPVTLKPANDDSLSPSPNPSGRHTRRSR